jgi:hypothetical protein
MENVPLKCKKATDERCKNLLSFQWICDLREEMKQQKDFNDKILKYSMFNECGSVTLDEN